MRKITTYPKILIISEFSFNNYSGGGILFRNLFEDFPKSNIAMFHEDLNFNGKELGLSICMKKKNFIISSISKFFPSKIKYWVKSKLFKSASVNFDIIDKIKSFKPDIIYSILGNESIMDLIKQIHETLKIPLVIHIMDNWIDLKENQKLLENFHYFLNNAIIRIAINRKMSDIYSKKYSKNFHIIHNAISRGKIKKVNNSNKIFKILYIGSIYKNAQLHSLLNISNSIESLFEENINIKFHIFLPKHQLLEYKPMFKKFKSILIGENNFNDEDYFLLLSQSNLLILASNFDKDSINYYKYSWPAKMPSYLMSGIPIFILGPSEIFFISEARKKNWALVCNENNHEKIKKQIYKILFNDEIKKNIIKNAMRESKEFEIEKMKKKFSDLLNVSTIKI